MLPTPKENLPFTSSAACPVRRMTISYEISYSLIFSLSSLSCETSLASFLLNSAMNFLFLASDSLS